MMENAPEMAAKKNNKRKDARPRRKSRSYDTETYFADFERMPRKKQEKHLLFIIQWAINFIRGEGSP